jgi:hypothetical protein
MCFEEIMSTYDKYRTEINKFKDIGFDAIKKKEQEEDL